MIYVRTCAYNAEKTLKKAVDSILNQTYQDFEYHILDNGSTDRTGELIRQYARKDPRIVPYYNKVNRDFGENPDFWSLSKRVPEGDFFCLLDADDFYEKTFFEEILRFMEENRLEMAACGTVFRDGATGAVLGKNELQRSIIADTPAKLDAFFPTIHWNLRQVWGKLYTSKAAFARYETELPDWWPKAYGGDTVNVMECVKAVKGFGVYGKALHNYTVSKKSVSHKWISGREDADIILHTKAIEFLETLCGRVSAQNLCFLYCVYFHAVKDTLIVLFNTDLPLAEKLEVLCRILSHVFTKEMLAEDTSKFGVSAAEKQALLRNILKWLETRACERSDAPALSAVYTALNPDFERFIPVGQLLWYIDKAPGVVSSLAGSDYKTAARLLEDVLSQYRLNCIPLELAKILAALFENQNAYVAYSKDWIQALIQNGDVSRAAVELSEWESILPEDADFAKLRQIARESGRS